MDTKGFALAAGAAARLTRLVTSDTITEPARNAVLFSRQQRRALAAGDDNIPPPDSPRAARTRAWAHSLMTCDWCAGLWISAGVVGAAALASRGRSEPRAWFTVPAAALTASYLVGYAAEH